MQKKSNKKSSTYSFSMIIVVMIVFVCCFGRDNLFSQSVLKERSSENQQLKNLLEAESSTGKELVLEVQTIVTKLRSPKFNIEIDRPSVYVPIDDTKLGNVKRYIEDKAKQTFYKIKIDEMAPDLME